MAIESVAITPGSGKDIAVDTIAAVEYQVVKIMLGADGSATLLLAPGQSTKANSIPVAIASDQDALAVTAASLPLPSGAATSALQGGGLPAALGAGGGVKVDGSGTALPVSAASLPLPSGAATSALQGGGLPAALGAGGGVKVDGSGTALPVSAASLPLPSGAATSALQGGGLPAALGAGGGVKVDGSGTALPISGTVTVNGIREEGTSIASFTRPSDTTAYAAGDVVADSTSAPTVITFNSVSVAGNNKPLILMDVIMVDGANQSTSGLFELWLFSAAPGLDNDNAVFTPTDAELQTLLAIVPLSVSYVGDATAGAGGNRVYISDTMNKVLKTGASVDDIYGELVVRNAYTPVSGETFYFILKFA